MARGVKGGRGGEGLCGGSSFTGDSSFTAWVGAGKKRGAMQAEGAA